MYQMRSQQHIVEEDRPRWRNTDPETSVEASEISADRMSRLKSWIVDYLRNEVMADHDLVTFQRLAALNGESPLVTPQRVRTARRELADAGVLVSTNIIRFTPTGRKAQTWTVASS